MKFLKYIYNYLFLIGFVWMAYGMVILSFNSCGLFMKEAENNLWNLYHTYTDDETGYHYDVFYDGPMEISEAEEIISDCVEYGQSLKKKYGTIFNLNKLNSQYSFMIDLFILFFPLMFLYYLHKKFRGYGNI